MAGSTDTSKFAAYLSYQATTDRWHVRSIDISHTGVLHKVTYPDQPPLQKVFVPPLAQVISTRLSEMDRDGEMLSLSDYTLELPGVSFSRLRMHTGRNVTRGNEASFWFSSYAGQPLMALRQYADAMDQLPQTDRVNNLAINAIDRVIIPALNVVTAVRSGVRSTQNVEVFEEYTSRLLQEADDLIMYAELVKRLIHSQTTPAVGVPPAPTELKDITNGIRSLEMLKRLDSAS